MKIKNFIIILLLLIANNSYAQTPYYYYYKGDKQYFFLNTEYAFLSLKEPKIPDNLLQCNISFSELKSDNGNKKIYQGKRGFCRYWTELHFNERLSVEEYFAFLAEIKFNNKDVIISPYFKSNEGEKTGLSNFFYVKLKAENDAALLRQMAEQNECIIIEQDVFMPLWFVLSATPFSNYNSLELANLFYESGFFQSALPDLLFNSRLACANDPYFDLQWGLKNTGQDGGNPGIDIKACEAWEITTGNNVVVAVVDQGVYFHQDLDENILIGYDTETDSIWFGVHGSHGTECAGIISAIKDNDEGIAGVAPNSKIMAISNTMLTFNDYFVNLLFMQNRAKGINWAWQNGADVINNSWREPFQYELLDDAIDNAVCYGRDGLGCIVCFAAGNAGIDTVAYPARLSNVIAVGAIENTGVRAAFSNYDNSLDIVAPGSQIITTSFGDMEYVTSFGTSYATPHVAGVAALILSVNPNLTGQEVRNIIESTAQKVRTDLYDYQTTVDRPNGTWHEEMGHGLVDAYAAVLKAQCYSLPTVQGTITQNTTWSTPLRVVGPVTIPNNITLTITTEVRCDENVHFTIQFGGTLIINGGTLTNACEDEMWQGIIVLGDPRLPSQDQGYVSITNGGAIANAHCGITVSGGRVYATKAHFVNNTMGVKAEPVLAGHNGTYSSFHQTNFVLNEDYFGNPADFEAHIIAQSSGKVNVFGCTFSSTAPQNISIANRNNGIVAFNTNVSVEEYCLGAMNIYTGCEGPMDITTFSGFNHAISAAHSGVSPILQVRNARFDDNINGVTVNGIHYHKLTRNTFTLVQHKTFGAHISNATGYKIEENLFKDNQLNSNNTTIGLLVSNSGIAENEVYKNTYSGLVVGQLFCEMNANATRPYTGLQTLCNDFHNGKDFDILTGDTPYLPISMSDHSIHKYQGNPLKSAGNLFYDNPAVNIKIQDIFNAITYYYGSLIYEEPLVTTNVTKFSATTNNCPSKIGGYNDTELAFSQYDEWNDEYEYWLAKLLATEADDEEYEMLLGMVSYYSALKDNHFNGIIVSAMNIWGDEGESRKQKAESGKEANWDTFYKKLRYLFSYRNHYIDNFSIAETYMAENNYMEALATLVKMYDQFELTEEQANELTGLEIYILWLQQLENEQKSIYKLSERELDYLVNYVETHTGRGTVFANNILCELYGICIEEEAEGGMQKAESNEDEVMRRLEDEMMQTTAYHSPRTVLENITLVPNPTTGELRISPAGGGLRGWNNGELRIENVEVFDVYGRNHSSLVTCHASLIKINISHLQSGIYFVKITTEAGITTRKIIKN